MYAVTDGDALVIVDPQNDFLPGGSLAVADGFRIFDPINRIAPHFAHVFATRDWHPEDHAFFQAKGGPWPFHCLAGTKGAEFSDRLHLEHVHEIVSKGTDPDTDGYSGFAGTDLERQLREGGVTRIFVCGLATDYCVKATAVEARDRGFDVVVLTDAIAAVNLQPGDEAAALQEMQTRGATLATTADLDFTGRAA
jgi:nicotinamidase/pyrazinamidase